MQGSYCSQINALAQITIRLKGHPCKGLAFLDIPRKLFPSNSASVQAHITHPISSCFVCSFERHFKLQPLFWGTYEYSCYFKEDCLVKPHIKSWLKPFSIIWNWISPLFHYAAFPNTVWTTPVENRLALRIWKVHFCSLVLYLRGKRCSAEKYIVQIKEKWIGLFFSIWTDADANTNNGNFPPLQLILLLKFTST